MVLLGADRLVLLRDRGELLDTSAEPSRPPPLCDCSSDISAIWRLKCAFLRLTI